MFNCPVSTCWLISCALAQFSHVITGIGHFKDTLSIQVKDGVKPHKVPLHHVACALQKPFRIITRKPTRTPNTGIIMGGQNSLMVQQHHHTPNPMAQHTYA